MQGLHIRKSAKLKAIQFRFWRIENSRIDFREFFIQMIAETEFSLHKLNINAATCVFTINIFNTCC